MGGGVALVLSLTMALGIFAGTGMDVKAADGLAFNSASSYYNGNAQRTEASIYNLVKDNPWLTEDELLLYQEWIDGHAGDGIYIISAKENPAYNGNFAQTAEYLFQYVWKKAGSVCYYVDNDNNLEGNTCNYIDMVQVLVGGSISSTSSGNSNGASSSFSDSYVSHIHSYSWVTVQDVSSEQDGIEEYRCSCGDVQERCVIPRYMAIVKGLYGAVKDAPQNGTATFDTGSAFTMTDYVIRKLSERTDVTTVITFEYQNQAYKMTIPAGADFTGLLADEEYFYGYFFFANAVGATIEAIA